MLNVLVLNAVDNDVRVGTKNNDEVDERVEEQNLIRNACHGRKRVVQLTVTWVQPDLPQTHRHTHYYYYYY